MLLYDMIWYVLFNIGLSIFLYFNPSTASIGANEDADLEWS